jgi:hypothetical protein
MVVTIVRFPSPEPVSSDEARRRFGANAASYLEVPGLLWKAYLRSDDGTTVGGVYWWRDRSSAEAKYNGEWRAGMVAKYGAEPRIDWFEAPVVVDALAQVVRVEAPENS